MEIEKERNKKKWMKFMFYQIICFVFKSNYLIVFWKWCRGWCD